MTDLLCTAMSAVGIVAVSAGVCWLAVDAVAWMVDRWMWWR